MSESRVRAGLAGLADLLRASQELSPRVAALASRYASVLRSGRTLFFCGNGGRAEDAQHLARSEERRGG
jgi:phosphoheptose isomerase